ncbi:protein phosphatase 2C domain-containing protein [Bradyrhizobium sp. ARR65]|uniref:PP2C family protein-serine/threonine phosphatase n=1 Tax=Bradyrhizobium sp. ARR65 TaxID=1040989 RepID=UPI000464A69E|nr:protein phosphatase 2C domain-containing protein [Bradyrhizobium sp. ARR65]
MPAWYVAAFTHRGRVRSANEGALAVDGYVLTGDMTEPYILAPTKDICVLMIADGMGGHAGGAQASRVALDHLVANAGRLVDQATCAEAIQNANDHLYGMMRSQPEVTGMGSTLVGAILSSSRILAFNVGDSRLYLQTHDHLVQLSQDDVGDRGVDASGRRTSYAITQALGGSEFPVPVDPHVSVDPPLAPGETLLLCSDRLTDMLADNATHDVLSGAADPNSAVRELAARAFRAGAQDDLSLIVARLA